MLKFLFSSSLLLIFTAFLPFIAYSQPHKKAIFIIVDGIPADVIERVNTPTLDAIAEKGGYTRAFVGGEKGTYNETPTISAPGYMNLITGTWGNKHAVVDNYHQTPNYNYPNIFRIIEDANPEKQTAIFSTWTDNRTVLIGEGKPETHQLKLDYSFDGLEKDTVNFPHDPLTMYIWDIDQEVVKHTAERISENGPDLSWVYLQFTDNVGHGLGDGEQFDRYVRETDKLLALIWEAVQKRIDENQEEWMLVITTDHGRDSKTGKSHGQQSERERTTWVVSNQSEMNERYENDEIAIVDLLPSILDFLEVDIPKEIKRELDGTSFIGTISASNLTATYSDHQLSMNWKAWHSGKANFYVTFSNNYATGGTDEYTPLVKDIEVSTQRLTFKLDQRMLSEFQQSGFLKIVMETPGNTLNAWIVD